ncbi:MAG: hypothetical protein AAF411_24075 [Myxococcota bacterium]
MARNSLILGLVSIALAFIGFFMIGSTVGSLIRLLSPIAGVAGIVFGGMALRSSGDAGDSNGSAFALGGLALSIMGFLFGAIVFVACGAGTCAAGAVQDAAEAAAQQQPQ